jgi:hypothetical protein
VVVAAALGTPVTVDPIVAVAADTAAVAAEPVVAAAGEEDADETRFMLKPIW